jgi:hypothetical protein
MESIESLNSYLNFFNKNEGEYLNLVGDENKFDVVVSGEIKINDFNNGALGNYLQFEYKLSNFLIDNLNLKKSSDYLLDFVMENYYGYKRLLNETDSQFYSRVLKLIFDIKCTPIAIIKSIEEFGTNIELVEGFDTGAWFNLSYFDNQKEIRKPGVYVRASFFESSGGNPYFFRIFISGLQPENYKKIIERINNYKSAGINYIVQLNDLDYFVGFGSFCFCDYEKKNLTKDPPITFGFVG